MPVCLIPVKMEAPVPLWPASSPADVLQASQARSVKLISMSVTFQDAANMVAPASTFLVLTDASAPRASRASTVTALMCPVHPHPVSMEVPAVRLVTSLLNATACQVRNSLGSREWEQTNLRMVVEGGRGSEPPLGRKQGKGEVRACVGWVASEGGVLWAHCGP